MASQRNIKKELKRLRAFIESKRDSTVETRVAWEVEQAIRWATEKTSGWELPLESVMTTAKIIRVEIARSNPNPSE